MKLWNLVPQRNPNRKERNFRSISVAHCFSAWLILLNLAFYRPLVDRLSSARLSTFPLLHYRGRECGTDVTAPYEGTIEFSGVLCWIANISGSFCGISTRIRPILWRCVTWSSSDLCRDTYTHTVRDISPCAMCLRQTVCSSVCSPMDYEHTTWPTYQWNTYTHTNAHHGPTALETLGHHHWRVSTGYLTGLPGRDPVCMSLYPSCTNIRRTVTWPCVRSIMAGFGCIVCVYPLCVCVHINLWGHRHTEVVVPLAGWTHAPGLSQNLTDAIPATNRQFVIESDPLGQ